MVPIKYNDPSCLVQTHGFTKFFLSLSSYSTWYESLTRGNPNLSSFLMDPLSTTGEKLCLISVSVSSPCCGPFPAGSAPFFSHYCRFCRHCWTTMSYPAKDPVAGIVSSRSTNPLRSGSQLPPHTPQIHQSIILTRTYLHRGIAARQFPVSTPVNFAQLPFSCPGERATLSTPNLKQLHLVHQIPLVSFFLFNIFH